MAASSELRKWKAHSASVRAKYNIPSGDGAWSWVSQPGRNLSGLPQTPRVLDCLDICFAVARARNPQAPMAKVAEGLLVNVSQSVGRIPLTYSMPTPATSTLVYSFKHDQIVSPMAVLRYLGWPEDLIPSTVFSSSELRKIGGNAFSVPATGLLMILLFFNPFAPWWKQQGADSPC